jgi:hypothetical protein
MTTTRSAPARVPTANVAVTATVRLAMFALTATGHYAETEDSFEWLVREAVDVVAAIESRSGAGRVAAVMAVLADTGFHDAADPVQAACLRRDAENIVIAVTTGAVVGDAGSCGGWRR